ncbi:hypothetical protein [Streptomyces sp. DSM 118878]
MHRPGVLIVAGPGGTRERLAVEAELTRRAWPCVAGPGQADLLVVAGASGTAGDDWARAVWGAIPAPKALVTVSDAEHVGPVLDQGLAELALGDHGHAGHDMAVVAGLPMADRADDRDGLILDRLHVPLGPALPDWPAGLILRVSLQGDVVQEAAVESAAAPPSPRPPFWSEPWLRAAAGGRVTEGEAARRRCAAHLDSLGRFFAVAGWDDMAARARDARDRGLAGAGSGELCSLVRPVIRRAERSRTLRWLTSGLGVLPAERASRCGVSGPASAADGDVHSRMLVWLDEVGRSAAACEADEPLGTTRAVGPRGRVDGAVPPSRGLLDALPHLLAGTEFACARVIIASLDPDLDELSYLATSAMTHG